EGVDGGLHRFGEDGFAAQQPGFGDEHVGGEVAVGQVPAQVAQRAQRRVPGADDGVVAGVQGPVDTGRGECWVPADVEPVGGGEDAVEGDAEAVGTAAVGAVDVDFDAVGEAGAYALAVLC